MKRLFTQLLLLVLMCSLVPLFAEGLPEGFDSHLRVYKEYVRTLWYLTEKADGFSDQQNPQYLEIYTQGHFFKDRVSQEHALLKKLVKANPEASMNYMQQLIAKDSTGQEFAVLKKIFGYNLRILKAKNPSLDIQSYLPKRAGGTQQADSNGIFFSVEDRHDTNIPAPTAPSDWAIKEYERFFTPTTLPSSQPALAPAFDAYGAADSGRQQADRVTTGWVAGQYVQKEGNQVTVTASSMNVRGGPSTDNPVVGKVVSGQKLTVISEKDGWFEVQIPSQAVSSGMYRKIVLVKGNVPYLVQGDSFLGQKEVILTFDDGPSAQDNRTSTAIKALQGAKAAGVFFCLGNTLKQSFSAPLIKAMKAAGSFPAVHGFYHATSDGKPFTALPWETISQHLTQTKELLKGMTGDQPVFFRPPYGIIRLADLERIENNLHLIPVGWTIDSLDWSIKSPDELFKTITGLIAKRGKGVVLMHDIHAQSLAVLPRLLAWFSQNGYTVVGPERLMDAFTASRGQ
ncbi:MAG: polysaccharide deacetylase family protein [Candidatus Ozemobacteraceae bacterium]